MKNASSPAPVRKVLVFCGSSAGRDPAYMRDARALGGLLAARGYEVLYGGGLSGMMGAVARAAADAGGTVTGIMPPGFHRPGDYELPRGVTEKTARTLMERKEKLLAMADAAIILPGGIGTFDEYWEMAAAQDLRQHLHPDWPPQPVLVVNTNGYYDDMRRQTLRAQEEGFIKPGRENLIRYVETPLDAVAALDDAGRVPAAARRAAVPGMRP